MIDITEEKIEIDVVIESVQDPSAGGIDVFIGTTRDHANGKNVISLSYEAYGPMALGMMQNLAEEIRRRWKVKKISMIHRVGSVGIGEASVVIAVSAEHRGEAFDACRYAIDALKKDVPIWKKEIYEDGEVWIGAQTTERH